MLSDYLSEKGRKALEIAGWPMWEEAATVYSLASRPTEIVTVWVREATCFERKPKVQFISDHEALCILREWFRVWLLANGCDIGMGDGEVEITEGSSPFRALSLAKDIDKAYIAAVLALKEAA